MKRVTGGASPVQKKQEDASNATQGRSIMARFMPTAVASTLAPPLYTVFAGA
jgi:hypothetical protein